AAGKPHTPAAGTRISQFAWRGFVGRQGLWCAGSGQSLCPRSRAVGAARIALGIPSHSFWPVSLSPEPQRIRLGGAFGRGFTAAEPSAQRPQRACFGSLLLRNDPTGQRQVGGSTIAF